jgi:hypothetical protein
MKVLIAIAHKLTQEQMQELSDYELIYLEKIDEKLFYNLKEIVDFQNIAVYARMLFNHAVQYKATVLPIGSPRFMAAFTSHCETISGRLFFSDSLKESTTKKDDSGKVVKTSTFRHIAFRNIHGYSIQDLFDELGEW